MTEKSRSRRSLKAGVGSCLGLLVLALGANSCDSASPAGTPADNSMLPSSGPPTPTSPTPPARPMPPATEPAPTSPTPPLIPTPTPPVTEPTPTPTSPAPMDPPMAPPVVEPPPLESEVSLSDHPCLKRPKITVVEPGRYKEEYRKVAEPDETFDMRGTFFEGNPPKFPIWITPNPGACLVGPTVQGQQSRSLTWRDLKKSEGHILDGDAIGWDGRESKGPYEIVGAWLDNMEDAFGPPKSPGDTEGRRFKISHVYARYIRDDFIENDACSDMELHDSLIDGTFAFISARPGVDNTAQPTRPGHTIIRNTVVRMQCMPGTQDNGNGTCPAGNSVGQIFKWGRCSGDVDIKDTIIRVDANVVTLTIPPGKYENVTLIWLGPGDNFPVRNGPLPPGIRVTKDVSIWEKARAEWLKRHGCDPKGDSCSFLKKSPE